MMKQENVKGVGRKHKTLFEQAKLGMGVREGGGQWAG